MQALNILTPHTHTPTPRTDTPHALTPHPNTPHTLTAYIDRAQRLLQPHAVTYNDTQQAKQEENCAHVCASSHRRPPRPPSRIHTHTHTHRTRAMQESAAHLRPLSRILVHTRMPGRRGGEEDTRDGGGVADAAMRCRTLVLLLFNRVGGRRRVGGGKGGGKGSGWSSLHCVLNAIRCGVCVLSCMDRCGDLQLCVRHA